VTRLGIRVAYEPSGEPVGSQLVRVKNASSGATLAVGITDEDGLATWAVDANPGPAYFQITGQPGGDRTWDSRDAFNAGIVPMSDIPVVLRGLDGVVGEYIGELEVALGTGNTVTLASGCAVLLGHPVVNLGEQTIAITRPGSLTRIDRVVARLYPQEAATTPGYAVFALLAGTEGGSAPDLTQSADVWEISLAQLSVPVADPITVTDERTYANQRSDVTAEVLDDSTSTTSAAGEALTGLSTSLTLSRAATYDIEATITARQTSVTPDVPELQLEDTYTYGSNMDEPRQVAVNPVTGNVYVANWDEDSRTTTSTLFFVSDAGVYGTEIHYWSLPSSFPMWKVSGVCCDSSGNAYANGVYDAGDDHYICKYNAALTATSWAVVADSESSFHGECATDSTHVYFITAQHRFTKRLCSTGAEVLSEDLPHGSQEGKAQALAGCAVDGTYLYLSDWSTGYINKFLKSDLSYVTRWSGGAGVRGLAIDTDGNVVAANPTTDTITYYTTTGTQVSQMSFTNAFGVAFSAAGDLWITSNADNTLTKYAMSGEIPGGYGTIAVAFDGTPGTYTGIGEEEGMVTNSHVTTATGPTSVTVAAFGKRTTETLTLESACLSVRAKPRR
jgi:hypothetical protein